MYEKHFGFTSKPFSIVPNPGILFLSQNHENALSYLEYGLSEKVGFILLTGEIGAGKTTLIRYMLNKMTSPMDVAVIFNTSFSADQLISRILSEFEIPSDTTEKERHLELLYQFLIERYARGRHALLIIDESQNLSDQALEDIRMLSNLQTDDHVLLQIMLVGQTELKDRLNTPGLRQLAQRIVVNYHLAPLSEKQTHQYIAYRLQAAGGPADLFSPEAMQLIYEHADGIPRTINLLCDAALVYGYGDNLKGIDRAAVEKVLADKICLVATSQKSPPPPLTDASPPVRTDILQQRLTAIEDALTDLQYRQEMTLQEVKDELLVKFQEMLNAEHEPSHGQNKEDIPDPYDRHVFRDSALEHTTEAETDPLPWEMVGPDPGRDRQSPLDALKTRLLELPETVIPPFLALVRKWTEHTTARSYQRWILLALVPIVILGLVISLKSKAPDKNTNPPQAPIVMPEKGEPSSVKEPPTSVQQKTAPAKASDKAVVIHTIQPGESLLSIAKHYRIPAELIKRENNMTNSHLIFIGKTLKIPTTPDYTIKP